MSPSPLVDAHPTPALCQCGCGGLAPIATQTDTRRGVVKGRPRRFIQGHNQSLQIEYRDGKKRCSTCREWKRPEQFYAHRAKSDGLQSVCRACQLRVRYPLQERRRKIKVKWGLTVADYESILARGCAICGSGERLHLDHDHRNGQIRAALCQNCNLMLGQARDEPDRLRAGAIYLEEWKALHG